jgi:hypothetical protein
MTAKAVMRTRALSIRRLFPAHRAALLLRKEMDVTLFFAFVESNSPGRLKKRVYNDLLFL